MTTPGMFTSIGAMLRALALWTILSVSAATLIYWIFG
tara:strand:- start:151 stop:261 length:111 start_codon:yes stop_codon:yes gene_type:complete